MHPTTGIVRDGGALAGAVPSNTHLRTAASRWIVGTVILALFGGFVSVAGGWRFVDAYAIREGLASLLSSVPGLNLGAAGLVFGVVVHALLDKALIHEYELIA